MEQTVRIVKCNPDGTARVVHIRESACSGNCHKCQGCGAVKQTMYLTAHNPIGASVGDVVVLHSRSASVLAGAAMVYLLPLVLFLLGYAVGQSLWQSGILTGLAGLAVAMCMAIVYDRRVLKKRNTVYTITGYAR